MSVKRVYCPTARLAGALGTDKLWSTSAQCGGFLETRRLEEHTLQKYIVLHQVCHA